MLDSPSRIYPSFMGRESTAPLEHILPGLKRSRQGGKSQGDSHHRIADFPSAHFSCRLSFCSPLLPLHSCFHLNVSSGQRNGPRGLSSSYSVTQVSHPQHCRHCEPDDVVRPVLHISGYLAASLTGLYLLHAHSTPKF